MYVHRGRSRREETFGNVFRRVCQSNFLNTVFFIIILIILIIFLPEKGFLTQNSGYESTTKDEISKFKLHGETEESKDANVNSDSSPYASDVEWEDGVGGFLINDFEEENVDKVNPSEGEKRSSLMNFETEQKINEELDSKNENSECKLFDGEWERDNESPSYSASTCSHISTFANCKDNGRPDRDYESWRWNPRGSNCFLPRFNATLFFTLMKNKTIVFVGDTLARNQMESLLCLLSQKEKPVNKGNKRMSRYIFRSNQMVLIRLWSAWLLRADVEPHRNQTLPGFRNVHLDIVDKNWAEILPSVHLLVLCSGHWWARPSAFLIDGKVVGGEKWWVGSEPKQITNLQAFELGLRTVFKYLSNAKDYKGVTVFRTISPVHYSLNSNSLDCEENTLQSVDKAASSLKSIMKLFHSQLTLFREAVRKRTRNGSKFLLLNITVGSAQRSDGHPGLYGLPVAKSTAEKGSGWSDLNASDGLNLKKDCMNWCLPGPIDSWNEIMLELIRGLN